MSQKKKHAKRKTTLKAKKKEIKENHPQHPCAQTKNHNRKKVKRETRQKQTNKQVAAFVTPCIICIRIEEGSRGGELMLT